MFNTEGVFFRTEGGEANTFGDNLQLDQMQRITGSMQPNVRELFPNRSGDSTSISRLGAFSSSTLGQNVNTSVNSGGRTIRRMNFDSSNSPNSRTSSVTSGETRPLNRTIRVWRRTG